MEGLGVPINLSKSVVASNSVIEFAKVTGYYGKNVSAISWKMFMSQASMMGRVNIVYSLLNKDIISSRPISWIMSLLKKSKYDNGEMNFSFVALLSMYSKSGKVPFKELIKSLYSESKPDRKLYKGMLDNVKLPYIQNIIAKVSLGREVNYSSSKLLNSFWAMDHTWFKKALLTPIQRFYKRLIGG